MEMHVLHQKSPAAYPPQPATPSSETHSLALELVSKNNKLLRYGKHSCLIQRSKRGFFYKNVTDKVFEALEELGIWLCHNG